MKSRETERMENFGSKDAVRPVLYSKKCGCVLQRLGIGNSGSSSEALL